MADTRQASRPPDGTACAKGEKPGTGPRSRISTWNPCHPGHGKSRSWTRVIRGRLYSFAAIAMPDGERRYSASRYDGPEDMLQAGRTFGCDWTRLFFVTFPPPARDTGTGDE